MRKVIGLGAISFVITVLALLFATREKPVETRPYAEYTMPQDSATIDENFADSSACCNEACFCGPCAETCTCCDEEYDSEFSLAMEDEPEVTDGEECDKSTVIGYGILQPVIVPMGFGLDEHGNLGVIYVQAYQLKLALINPEGNFELVDCPGEDAYIPAEDEETVPGPGMVRDGL